MSIARRPRRPGRRSSTHATDYGIERSFDASRPNGLIQRGRGHGRRRSAPRARRHRRRAARPRDRRRNDAWSRSLRPRPSRGPREAHHADRLSRRSAARPRDAGDRHRDVARGCARARPRAIAARGRLRHGAVLERSSRRHAQHLDLGFVRIGDEAAVEPAGAARDVGDRARDEPAGARLGGRAQPAARAQRGAQRRRASAAIRVASSCIRPAAPR